MRLFLSADLAGSTAYKQNSPPEQWQRFFRSFYQEFPALVVRHSLSLGLAEDSLAVWKLIGDEVVFSRELRHWEEAGKCLKAFRRALADFRLETLARTESRLDLKAAAWTAGFPVGNIRIEPSGQLGEDYIGPGMDVGFRLVKAASPRRMLLSVELGWLLTLPNEEDDHQILVGGGLDLKGVAKGGSYPCIWLDNFAGAHALEAADQLVLDEQRLQGIYLTPCNAAELHDFCERWINQMGPPFLVPFIADDPIMGKPPANYTELYEQVIVEAEQGSVDDSNEPQLEGSPTSDTEILKGLTDPILRPDLPS